MLSLACEAPVQFMQASSNSVVAFPPVFLSLNCAPSNNQLSLYWSRQSYVADPLLLIVLTALPEMLDLVEQVAGKGMIRLLILSETGRALRRNWLMCVRKLDWPDPLGCREDDVGGGVGSGVCAFTGNDDEDDCELLTGSGLGWDGVTVEKGCGW